MSDITNDNLNKMLDQLVEENKAGLTPDKMNGIISGLVQRLLQKSLDTELEEHLGYSKHDKQNNNSNSRNGYSKKTIKGDYGEVDIQTPRDRDGSFEPKIIKKNQTRFDGFDDKIISLYARGMSTRDIQSQLEEIYFARLAIEPKIAEISCQNQDSSLVKRLEEIDERLNTAIETNDVKAYLRGNYAFHFELYRAANTPILTDMAQSLWLRIGPSLRAVCASQGSSILPDQHEETVKGLAQQDARLVSKAIAEDIRQGMDHVRQAAIFNNSETEN